MGNIILTDDGRGLLIDWELAKWRDATGSRRPDRTVSHAMQLNVGIDSSTFRSHRELGSSCLQNFFEMFARCTSLRMTSNHSSMSSAGPLYVTFPPMLHIRLIAVAKTWNGSMSITRNRDAAVLAGMLRLQCCVEEDIRRNISTPGNPPLFPVSCGH